MVTFNILPEQTYVPFVYGEFDPTGTAENPSEMPYTGLIIGQMFSTGTAEPLVPARPMSAEQANIMFGEGSIAAQMAAYWLKANTVTKMLVIPVLDFEEGVAATGSVTFSGSVTSSAPVCLYIGGEVVRSAANVGTSAGAVASRLAETINATKSLAVTAANSDNTLVLTAKHKGYNGNDIDLRLSYKGEEVPGGLDIVITPMSGGVGNPDMMDVVTAMGNTQYHVIANSLTDTDSLDKLRDELNDRWGPLRQIDGQAIMVKRGTYGELTTLAGSRNDKHLTIIPNEGSPTLPWADAAASAAVAAYYGNNDPARGFNTLLVPGVLAPAERDRWTWFPEYNQALQEGVSMRYVAPDGTVRFRKLITTYRMNELGAKTDAYLSLNSPLTLSYLRYDWRNYILNKYPRHKLASDGDEAYFDPDQPIMTPSLGKSEMLTRFTNVWLYNGLVEGLDDFRASLLCQRHQTNKNRLDWGVNPDLMNQFEVGGVRFRHLV